MLQQERPDDFVIGTGESHSVREFCQLAFRQAGMVLEWRGSDREEVGIVDDVNNRSQLLAGATVVAIDPRYFRPTEVEFHLADPSKAKREMG